MIYLKPEGGDRIPLRSLELERSFNKPHLWYARPANSVAAGLAIEAGAKSWAIELEEHGVLKDNLIIASIGYGFAQGNQEREHKIVLRDATIPGSVPRFHLHKDYQHLLGLFQASPLSESVLVSDPDTVNMLEAFTTNGEFVEGDTPTCLARFILQTGLTDLDFTRRVLGQWNITHPDNKMVLAFGDKWRIFGSWAREEPPAESLLIEDDLQLYSWSEFPGYSEEALSASMITYQANKPLNVSEFREAYKQHLPHYLERSGRVFTVGCRRDVIRPARSGTESIEWQIDLFSCAENWPLENYSSRPHGFAGGYRTVSGLVASCGQTSVDVILDGCSPDQPVVTGHLSTQSTGPDRVRGVHMPVYPDARVLVAVPTGLYTGPPVFMGDVRESDAPGANPSIMFDDQIEVISAESSIIITAEESITADAKTKEINLTAEESITADAKTKEINLTAGESITADAKTKEINLTAAESITADAKTKEINLTAAEAITGNAMAIDLTAIASLTGNAMAIGLTAGAALTGNAMTIGLTAGGAFTGHGNSMALSAENAFSGQGKSMALSAEEAFSGNGKSMDLSAKEAFGIKGKDITEKGSGKIVVQASNDMVLKAKKILGN
jgi:uncharacterized protein (DUF2345 family)